MIRVKKTVEVITDDFDLDEDFIKETKAQGVLFFELEESDPQALVVVNIGNKCIGYFTVDAICELAENLLEVIHKKSSVVDEKSEAKP